MESHYHEERIAFSSFVSLKLNFKKLFYIFFCVYLLLKKLINKIYFLVEKKFSLIIRKVFSFYFGWKTLSKSCEKFRNVILFADYIKFDTQIF